MKWVLVNNNSVFTISLAEVDFTSPTPNLEPSQLPSLHFTELLSESTVDTDPEPATMSPELNNESDQVHKPVKSPIPERVLVDPTSPESPASPASPLVLLSLLSPASPQPPVSPASPESPSSWLVLPSSESPMFPSSLPISPPLSDTACFSALHPLVTFSSSVHPQSAPSGCSDSPQAFQSPALPWLHVPSAPLWPIIPLDPLGSFVLLAPPWSVVNLPLLQDSTPPALLHPSISFSQSDSHIPPAPPQSSGFLPLAFSITLALCLPDPPGSPPLSPSLISMVLSTASPPWLLPLLTPPWSSFLDGLWIPAWLVPPSSPSVISLGFLLSAFSVSSSRAPPSLMCWTVLR
ncbi:hypothetical protein M9458_015741, partial [Cirrhinus mrigala]